jgi:hypothetical protein
MKVSLVVITGIFLAFPSLGASQWPELQARTDAFQYNSKAAEPSSAAFVQSWSFSFLDFKNEIAGGFIAAVNNPGGKLKLPSGTNTGAALIEKDRQFFAWGKGWSAKNPNEFHVSPTFLPGAGPEFHNPGLSVDVISENEYRIYGENLFTLENKKMRFDLSYRRLTDGLGAPWIPWENWSLERILGMFSSSITYYLHMPFAEVNGVVEVFDDIGSTRPARTYHLENAQGYHDGFHGKLLVTKYGWDWIDFKTEQVAVHMIYTRSPSFSCETYSHCEPGDLRFVVKKNGTTKSAFFSKPRGELSLRIVETQKDKGKYSKFSHPVKAEVTAKNAKGEMLTLTWSRRRVVRVAYDLKWPLPDAVAYSGLSDIRGEFISATGERTSFSGIGFTEATALTEKDLRHRVHRP